MSDPSPFHPGQPRPKDSWWLYTPRGGYGLPIPAKAEVVAVTAKRVRIKVWHERSGAEALKTVKPENL